MVEVSEKAQSAVAAVRAFVDGEVLPRERELLALPFEQALPALEALRRQVKERGLWAPHLPASVGGMGLSLAEFSPVAEELGRSPFGHYLFNCQAPDVGNMEILLQHGTEEQRQRFLEPLARGDIRSCFAMTEPERPGSNPVWMETRARVDGGDWVIDGHKWFTSAADGATFAVVMAVTDPDAARPHERASQILVPTDTPGFERVRNVPVMGHAGSGWHSHAEVRFKGCRVPRANLLGKQGAGFAMAQERLGPGRIHHCMRWIGICQRAFDLMCQRAVTRELEPGVPLAARQIVQAWIGESRAEIDAARLLVLDAAQRIDREGLHAAREQVSLIKFHVAAVLGRVLDRAIQTHGALGLTDETPLSYWYRFERGARIYDGPDEVHKTAAARLILRRYGLTKGTLA
jgi:alkylation response protein AidB-like acyl-CoA dehydrogenase